MDAHPCDLPPWASSEEDLPPGVTSTQQEEEHRWLLSTGFFDAEPHGSFDVWDDEAVPTVAAQVRYEDVGGRAA